MRAVQRSTGTPFRVTVKAPLAVARTRAEAPADEVIFTLSWERK
jgi:hypothetical protein